MVFRQDNQVPAFHALTGRQSNSMSEGRSVDAGYIKVIKSQLQSIDNQMSKLQPTDRKISPYSYSVSHPERCAIKGHQSACLWFTGLSGSGKSTIANAVDQRLNREFKVHTYILDGDNIRNGLNSDLGFSLDDRKENIRRVGEVAKLFMDSGLIVLTAFISPLRADREQARKIIQPGIFFEIYVDCPMNVCEQRDPKGLYQKARQGLIPDFTGIDSPYETPGKPEIVIYSNETPVEGCVTQIIEYLRAHAVVPHIHVET